MEATAPKNDAAMTSVRKISLAIPDIPTHTESYFPTPFLWPLPTPFVNGIPWSTPWAMLANYAGTIVVYSTLFLYSIRGARIKDVMDTFHDHG